jgi:hypothetical protein
MTMKAMPSIPATSSELQGWIDRITFKGVLRSSKPKKDGEAAYVWRMVAFQVSSKPQHHCMPCTADFDLPQEYWEKGAYEKRHNRIRELDAIANQIVDLIPKSQWHGIHRWGNVFGQIGTPTYNDEGAVIYR